MWMNFNILIFTISCLMFSFFYKHILMTLISLEFMMMNLMMNLYMLLINLNMNMYFMSLFISISVCESIMGLSTLVYITRHSNNDYMNNLNLMKW
uniref:NADH-ubiquinone oxidoreductase chain 4L n=1 Tax=Fopius arisanus TaxID=64838 RepID=A0A8F0JXR4_9HYME|nr:NADH dehydrogenase subunit 4L [Fopius arisanus]